jgi:hypothetical protein
MPDLLADEDEVPDLGENGQPPSFDFFGLGQAGPPPFNPQGDNDNVEQPMEENLEEPMAQQQVMGFDMNLAPQAEENENEGDAQYLLLDLNIVEGDD